MLGLDMKMLGLACILTRKNEMNEK